MKFLGWGAAAVGIISAGMGIGRKSLPVAGAGALITAIGVFLIVSEAEAAPPPADGGEILAFAMGEG